MAMAGHLAAAGRGGPKYHTARQRRTRTADPNERASIRGHAAALDLALSVAPSTDFCRSRGAERT
jgi:hypothetical protein